MTVHSRIDGPLGAPVLVLGASLGTTPAMWNPHLAGLLPDYRVVRYVHRGHDGPPSPPGPYTMDELGGDVLALLDRTGVERVSYCGVSLGGMVGMWLAAHAPERVDRLVLCCTSAYLPPARTWTDRAALVRAEGTAVLTGAAPERWFTAAFRTNYPEVVAALLDGLLSVDAEGYAGCCEAIAAMDLRPLLGRIGAPTLVIAGAEDVATPPEHAERIAAGIAGARLTVLDSAAHLAPVEHADAVTGLLRRHLEEGR